MLSHSPRSPRRRFRLLASVLVSSSMLLLLPSACGSKDDPDAVEGGFCRSDDDCAAGQFCASGADPAQAECKTSCPACGNPCDETADCPAGQFCTGGKSCQQECAPGTKDPVCGSNNTCSEDGQCVAADSINLGDGGAGGMSGGDGDGNAGCIDVEITFEPQTPNVVLLIDQSGSMNAANFSAGDDYVGWDCQANQQDWRWNVVRNVLLNPETGVVKPLEDKVRFGLGLYTSEGGSAGGTCPLLDPGTLEVDFGTHATMLDQFKCSDIKGDTPTRESLTATAEALAALNLDGPGVIVLATDGEPDNCTCPNWDNNAGPTCSNNESNHVMRGGELMSPAQAEQYDVVVEAGRIHEELGIQIEVINVSRPDNQNLALHLDQVAAHGGAVSGASIDGFNAAALSEAFQSIIDGVRSCAVDLDGEIAPGKESSGTVSLDGEKLEFGGPNGWKVNSPTQIELVGDACTTIKSGDHDLDIDFPCGSFVVIPK